MYQNLHFDFNFFFVFSCVPYTRLGVVRIEREMRRETVGYDVAVFSQITVMRSKKYG